MTNPTKRDADIILLGGGLANSLIAYRLRLERPELRLLVLEVGENYGGNHTWSFHATDLTAAQRRWTAPFVAHEWPFYHVHFPGFHRRVDLGYCSATSTRLHEVLVGSGIDVRFGTEVSRVDGETVALSTGELLTAAAVIDGRGPQTMSSLRLAWQKFVGVEVDLLEPHRLLGPILMDATVPQIDGYRFVYVLPFGPRRLLIEDTYYSEVAELNTAVLRGRALAYAADMGWQVSAVVREETGVLPITLDGDIEAFWAVRPGEPRSGLRAGLFHPTTGYSWPDAVRLADRIAAAPTFTSAALFDLIVTHAKERWRAQRMFRALNRMLFLAGDSGNRWAVMRRFYRLREDLIARFYAGHLTTGDKLRLLAGKPPVPVGAALKALVAPSPPA